MSDVPSNRRPTGAGDDDATALLTSDEADALKRRTGLTLDDGEPLETTAIMSSARAMELAARARRSDPPPAPARPAPGPEREGDDRLEQTAPSRARMQEAREASAARHEAARSVAPAAPAPRKRAWGDGTDIAVALVCALVLAASWWLTR